MNFVQPIRDPEQIQQMKAYLKEKNARNYMLFVLGINTGLRISDILKLKVGDVQGSHISMREKKTGKQKRIQITSCYEVTFVNSFFPIIFFLDGIQKLQK
ncbi:putative integrase/recombinase YoeC [Bacillus thuringiensis]|uniref:Integrase/recombinase YoeC n=1 Tax=Bacillus thuringiensis TaxID=1428 RepID=A0A9W3S6F8_BACTU|nr:putative integrase/recombinase YoeC [Bacillus thuringiensis]